MGAPERKQVVDHHGEPGHLVLDRLQLGGARTRALALPEHGRVGADDGEGIAQVVADLGDVEPAIAIEVAQTVREMLERPGNAADLAAPGDERDIAFAVAEPARGIDDGLELLAVSPARALEQPHADEEEHEADRCESLGLDQQEIAVEVLRAAGDGEHPQRPRALLGMVPRADARPARAAAISSASPPARAPSIQARRVPGTDGISPRCNAGSAALRLRARLARPSRATRS